VTEHTTPQDSTETPVSLGPPDPSVPVDALLVLSFGGPEHPNDVMPFLRNVTRGRNVPDERLAEVAEQYEVFGGVSPINAQCRDLVAAVEQEFAATTLDLPVYFGARNWHPYLADTLQRMADDGVRRALVFVTSAFGSYSGCRQYRENLAEATEVVADRAPHLQKLRLYYNHPGFVETMASKLAEGRRHLTETAASGADRVVFTAHSIPVSMAAACDYEVQLREAARLVMDHAGYSEDGVIEPFDLVYQSRSGPPRVPWLEPDINDHLAMLSQQGVGSVVVVPLGFVSDHMEVMFDLDTQAAQTAAELGLGYIRVPTAGTDPRFVTMIRNLVEEQTVGAPRLALGDLGPWPDQCPPGHCLPPRRPAASNSTGPD
jgi:ferrochelatase